MQKLTLTQSLQQKLSPQQIQFIKLLQIPTLELEKRIEEELEINPALEEGKEKEEVQNDEAEEPTVENMEEYFQEDDYTGYKMQGDGKVTDDEWEMPIQSKKSLHENLINQLGYLILNEKEYLIGKQLIGSIEGDGYIRRDVNAIVNDLAFSQSLATTVEEIEKILKKIQQFDPPGIGARSLQECLILQLKRKEATQEVQLAIQILQNYFEDFSNKHYSKIIKKLHLNETEDLKIVLDEILKLNPKPGGTGDSATLNQNPYLIPDFILKNDNGKLSLSLNFRNAPELKVNNSYIQMLKEYEKGKKKNKKLKGTVTFIKQKLDAAKWFIDAIKQRQHTLITTMQTIIEIQKEYFLSGDESKLKPMILKDVATLVNMDISTISRVSNSKSIQTDFGIFPLKYFFSEGVSTQSGEDVTSKEVKNHLKKLIENENKDVPLSDELLKTSLQKKGYKIARRTVTKYREQLNFPVARLRKQLK